MGEGWYRSTVALGRVLFRALDLQLHVEGAHHLPPLLEDIARAV